jgi:hypothetical protein
VFQSIVEYHIIIQEGTPRFFECPDWEEDMKYGVLSGKENVATCEPEEELPILLLWKKDILAYTVAIKRNLQFS